MNTFQKALLVAGAVGLGATVSAPAFAGNTTGAYISGSSAIVLMNGASQSVGVEMSLPTGVYFPGVTAVGDVVVTPVLGNPAVVGTPDTGLAVNENDFASLTVAAGAPDSLANLPTAGATSFNAAAATALSAVGDTSANVIANLDEVVSIIKAGAGINGLD